MYIHTFETIDELRAALQLKNKGEIVEPDIDIVETECDLFGRRRRDAEVLSTIAANVSGNCLEFGTSYGRSTYEISMNIEARGTIYTVNILPEQASEISGKLVTHFLGREEIGAYYRDRNARNVQQIYADTASWEPPRDMKGLKLAFIDAAHDSDLVYGDSVKAYSLLGDGGYIVWHDFNPELRQRYEWIDQSMAGVERFCAKFVPEAEILHLKNSWMGVLRKPVPHSVPRNEPKSQPLIHPSAGNPRVLLGYSCYPAAYSIRDLNEGWLSRLRRDGFLVDGICLTINPPGPCLRWEELDALWRKRDRDLLALYAKVLHTIRNGGYEIFVNYNGINLHPDFVRELRRECFMVYCCFDDPESSDFLSRPVASSYDLAMVGNIAELDSYKAWGCSSVEWLPLGFWDHEKDPLLTERRILEKDRPVDVSIVCERTSPWRRERLDQFAEAFPQGRYYGNGWDNGFLPEQEKLNLYRLSKIGFNLHNSSGPINRRTFTVPANGAMLLCDNSSYLGKMFDLGTEAIGYDYMDEAIFHARFYLAHEQMRREIAAAGWHRVMRDYNEAACFRRILDAVDRVRSNRSRCTSNVEMSDRKGSPANAKLQHSGALGFEWRLDPARYTDNCILRDAVLEPATTALLMSLVKPGMKWMDVGANIGYYSLLLARLAGESGKGWAFEPRQDLASHLQLHLELNGFQQRVESMGIGLSDRNEVLRTGPDGSSVPVPYSNVIGSTKSNSIEIRRLDDLPQVLNGPRIDFIKIDIDGHEPFFFRGARKFLALHRPIIAVRIADPKLFAAGESIETLMNELKVNHYCVFSEKSLTPLNDAFSFLKECGSFAYSSNAWAVPMELSSCFANLGQLIASIPRHCRYQLDVFSSLTDMLVAQNVGKGAEAPVHVNALGHQLVWIRGKTTDYTVLWDACHYKYHLPPRQLGDSPVIVDLGCNVGITTAHFAYLYPGARILSVEMDHNNWIQARRNVFPFRERCTVVEAAIWNEDSVVSYNGRSEQGFHVDSTGDGCRVRSVRIDTLLSQHHINSVDYLKMDIEGAELQAFLSDPVWLNKVLSLKVELHRLEYFDVIWDILVKYGFKCSKEHRHYCCIEAVRSN